MTHYTRIKAGAPPSSVQFNLKVFALNDKHGADRRKISTRQERAFFGVPSLPR
jgi:hypothetical protein